MTFSFSRSEAERTAVWPCWTEWTSLNEKFTNM